MTIASLIVDVAANTAKLTKDVDAIHGSLDKITAGAAKMGKALVAGFTVAAISKAVMTVVDFSSKLTDLSGKTGISATGLQKLGLAFEQTGVSMETVAGAALKLQKGIGGDDKGLRKLADELGISWTELKNMAPEEAFFKVADAIGKIPNQNEKALAATKAFGKGGMELLAGLNGTLADTVKKYEEMGLIISEDVVAAGDEFGDQLGLLSTLGLSLLAQVIGPLLPGLSQLAIWFGTLASGAMSLTKALTQGLIASFYLARIAILEWAAGVLTALKAIPFLGKHLGFADTALAQLSEDLAIARDTLNTFLTPVAKVADTSKKAAGALLGLSGASDDTAKTATKLKAELERNTDAARKVEAGFYGLTESVGVLNVAQVTTAEKLKDTRDLLRDIEAAGVPTANSFYQIADAMETLGRKAPKPTMGDLADVYGQWQGPINEPIEVPISFAKSLEGAFAELPSLLKSAFTGGGGVGGALNAFGTTIGTSLFGPKGAFSGIAKSATGSLSKLFGDTIGGALGAAIPGIGALIGPGLQLLWGGIKKLFGGPSKEELGGRDLVSTFEDQIHGMLTAQQKLEAGNDAWAMTVIGVRDKYLATGRSAAEAEAAVAKLWASSKEGAGATEAAIAALNLVLNEEVTTATAAASAVDAVRAAGDARLASVQEGIDKLVSKREGLLQSVADEAPEAVMGVIEAATRGQIKVLDQEIASQQAALEKEAQAIADAVERALSAIVIPTIHIKAVIDYPGGGVEAPEDIPGANQMAAGGFGRVTGPTLFMAGEAGPEDYAFSGANKAFGAASGGGGVDVSALAAEVAGLRRDWTFLIPGLIAKANLAARIKAGV